MKTIYKLWPPEVEFSNKGPYQRQAHSVTNPSPSCVHFKAARRHNSSGLLDTGTVNLPNLLFQYSTKELTCCVFHTHGSVCPSPQCPMRVFDHFNVCPHTYKMAPQSSKQSPGLAFVSPAKAPGLIPILNTHLQVYVLHTRIVSK